MKSKMIAAIFILCGMVVGIAYAQAATFTITLNFTDSAQRAAVLRDFAISHSLDIYTDATRTTVDSAKVGPAVQAFIRSRIKSEVVAYRALQAGNAARSSAAASENAAINP